MISKIVEVKRSKSLGYWGERIVAEIEYAFNISKVSNGKYDEIVDSAITTLLSIYKTDSVITKDAALSVENILMEISNDAKKYKIICAAHAHIDMNWMWRFDETVAVALDTFRTMLDLMKEYPAFNFSQSQASVYRIVEEYDTDMLEEIKTRVKEGRWEVTASTWVECDKNMPSGESLSRHILYTKGYLSKLFDIDPDSLKIDFEPDTFGHSANVPEILNKGGVKYYYHCRGFEKYVVYRWAAPSGNTILVYRDPFWYNGEINPSMALYVPEFCNSHGVDSMLKVYGVGDHGGGPTRRDIERILDMNTWPIFPEIRFGTFREYFDMLEKVKDTFPEVKDELNFIFTGCYTTQTRIKMANRVSEAALNESEAFSAVSSLCTASRYTSEEFTEAWENVLFNQFHDIIPGSGVVDTREYAMSLFQKTMAIANTRKSMALRSVSSRIDTSKLISSDDQEGTVSEGAGVGFGIKDFKVTQSSRGRGKARIFHVFNPSAFDRCENVGITMWDWKYDLNSIQFKDAAGNLLKHQTLDNGFNSYWGHEYLRVLVKIAVPAMGYSTIILNECLPEDVECSLPKDPRIEHPNEFILENEYIKAVFNPCNGSIKAIIDKSTGRNMVSESRTSGVFRVIDEDDSKGMTAWIVGRYMNTDELTRDVKIKKISSGPLRQSLSMECKFRNSILKAVVSLDAGSKKLFYDVECDWHEIGKPGISVPQLNFYLPTGYSCRAYKYDIPFGTTVRDGMDMDVPGSSFITGINKDDKKSLMLITNCKYGFRGYEDSVAVTLIRSSYDPDPYPELGIHNFSFGICLVENKSDSQLIDVSSVFNHPMSVISANAHEGDLPVQQSFISLKRGSIVLSSVKLPEDDKNKLLIRSYEVEGEDSENTIRLFKKPVRAYFADINEKQFEEESSPCCNGYEVTFSVKPFSVNTLIIEF